MYAIVVERPSPMGRAAAGCSFRGEVLRTWVRRSVAPGAVAR
jgi:hypothetical protein